MSWTKTDEVSAHGLGVHVEKPCGMCDLLRIQLERNNEEHSQTITELGHNAAARDAIIRKQDIRINWLMLALFALGCIVAYLVVRG